MVTATPDFTAIYRLGTIRADMLHFHFRFEEGPGEHVANVAAFSLALTPDGNALTITKAMRPGETMLDVLPGQDAQFTLFIAALPDGHEKNWARWEVYNCQMTHYGMATDGGDLLETLTCRFGGIVKRD